MALSDFLPVSRGRLAAAVAAARESGIAAATESWANHQVEIEWRRNQSKWLQEVNGTKLGRVDEQSRLAAVGRSRNNALNNPLIVRALGVYFGFVFGRGVSAPRLSADFEKMLRDEARVDAASPAPAQVERLNAIIADFWHDADNRRYLTGYRAQRDRYYQLLEDGELPLLLFEKAGHVTCVALDTTDIVDVVPHPRYPGVPLLWKRHITLTEGGERDEWYRAVETYGDDKTVQDELGKIGARRFGVAGKLRDRTADGTRIWLMMVRVNSADPMALRGHPPLFSAFPWSAAVQELVADLRTYLRALAAWAWKEKVTGTASDVAAARTALQSTTDGKNPRPVVAAVRVEGKGRDLEPINVGTGGAGSFSVAIDECLNMVYAAAGLPAHYFGDTEQGTLATATAMELPVRKLFEAEQQWWTALYDELIQFVARVNGFEVATDRFIEIDFPTIVERDAPSLLGALSQATATGVISQDDACRTAAYALGADDVEAWVERLESPDSGPGTLTELEAAMESEPAKYAPIVLRFSRKVRERLAALQEKA